MNDKENNNNPDPNLLPEQNGKKPKPFLIAALIIIGVFVVAFGIRYWRYAATHESTDDAYLTADVTQISPQVSGTIKQVLVDDNREVKKGDLLVILDDATYRASLAQAQANLDAAVAQAKGAGVNVALTTETSSAQVLQAQGGLAQTESGIVGARADVTRATAAIITAQANKKSAAANVQTARASVDAATANKQKAMAMVKAAQAALDAAQADSDRLARDANRIAKLVAQGAVSDQAADQSASAARSSKALVAQRQADLNGARQQLGVADAAINQAKAQLDVAREQESAAQAGVEQAVAQQQVSKQNITSAEARRQQAMGQLYQAQSAPRQISLSRASQMQAIAKIEQARAALQSAKLQLAYTRIFAPVDGKISKKPVEEGALVQPGTPLMAIVGRRAPWVVANFKETQLTDVRPGCRAIVKVDAFPGRKFKGHVDSIAAATGATFALLPPDNATGNFTKVVQRVPVKIMLDIDREDEQKLCAGLSVLVIIDTR